MEDRRTMEVRSDLNHFEDDAWGFGALMAVVVACFLVLGVVIYVFGDDASTQTAAGQQPQMERTMKAPQAAAEPSTVGQGGSP